MQSHIAIKHLEQYIQDLHNKKQCNSYGYQGNYIGADERILQAEKQIELYKKGLGRLQN